MPHPAVNHPRRRLAAVLLGAALLPLAAVPAGAVHIEMDTGDADIEIEGRDVVIETAGREARITHDGRLLVDGRQVRVDAAQQRDLVRYNGSMHWIEDTAIDMGVQGAGLAAVAVAEALAAIVHRDEDRAERRVEARAEELKESARELCATVRRLETLQNRLAAGVPAFRPFAVLELEADDCDVDD